ncbi:MAG: hypothetical protein LC798_16775 [Chloroflexi bacterium]|nr:hypothetical protein [Chloroflexota bacterium]
MSEPLNQWTPQDHIDLGSGHSFTWVVGDPEHHPTDDARLLRWHGQDETLVGIIEWHPRADGKPMPNGDPARCGGGVYFVQTGSGGRQHPVWQVVSLDPLHLEPSILCTPEKGGCGNHGWIRDGRWVQA